MNKIYNILKIGFVSLVLVLAACERNDFIDDLGRVGEQTPNAYWEVPSLSARAGNSVNFTAQYYSLKDTPIDHTEVWYSTNESELMLLTYASSAINYSKRIEGQQEVRIMQKIAEYPHSENLWDNEKKSYVLNSSFPVSNTLRLIEWREVSAFDPDRYNSLFPDTLATVFKRDLYPQLLANTTEMGRLMSTLNIYEPDEFRSFLDSTFNENTGRYDYQIKPDIQPVIKQRYDAIPFQDLLYDNSTQLYRIEYSKSYRITAAFRVYETNGVVGISEPKVIEIN